MPKWLDSVSSRHRPNRRGRLEVGPMPSRQWYLSAKQPPGHRTTTGPSLRTCSTRAVRMPPMFGILRSRPDPDAVVDDTADVFGELAVKRRADRGDRLIKQYGTERSAAALPRARSTRGKVAAAVPRSLLRWPSCDGGASVEEGSARDGFVGRIPMMSDTVPVRCQLLNCSAAIGPWNAGGSTRARGRWRSRYRS